MRSPYENLPPERFWRTGVAEHEPETVTGLYRKKFTIEPSAQIATAGSCFAQHIARYLRRNGYNVIDRERLPLWVPEELAHRYGYGLYSARYGNIYTVRQLLQLTQEAVGEFTPKNAVWTRDGRYFDALRPAVEPEGHETADLVEVHRRPHLRRVRQVLQQANIIIFTLGLTEAWIDSDSGTVFPTAPGTIAGDYAPDRFRFKNFTVGEIVADFLAFRERVRAVNPSVRFLLTVSPVPLTATATTDHVLAATTYSKSVLRTAAGELYAMCDDIDYFPSYEIIATPFSGARFYEPNLRSVTADGVDAVMRVFFAEHPPAQASRDEDAHKAPKAGRRRRAGASLEADDAVCEDILLDSFAR